MVAGRKAKDSGTTQPKKRSKKCEAYQLPDQAVSTEASDAAEAHPNLADAPTHGLNEPLDLHYTPSDGMHNLQTALASLVLLKCAKPSCCSAANKCTQLQSKPAQQLTA